MEPCYKERRQPCYMVFWQDHFNAVRKKVFFVKRPLTFQFRMLVGLRFATNLQDLLGKRYD